MAVSGSRGFFADRCNDSLRLTREYTVAIGPAPIVYLDGQRFCYKWTAVGASSPYITLQSFRAPATYEMVCLIKKNIQAPDNNKMGFQNYFTWRSGTNYYKVGVVSNIDINRIATGVTTWSNLVVPSPTYTNDIWYNYKFRASDRDVRVKIWQLGVAEPNWTANNLVWVAGGAENPIKRTRPLGDIIGFGTYFPVAGDTLQISDIRITPIRKVGGP